MEHYDRIVAAQGVFKVGEAYTAVVKALDPEQKLDEAQLAEIAGRICLAPTA